MFNGLICCFIALFCASIGLVGVTLRLKALEISYEVMTRHLLEEIRSLRSEIRESCPMREEVKCSHVFLKGMPFEEKPEVDPRVRFAADVQYVYSPPES